MPNTQAVSHFLLDTNDLISDEILLSVAYKKERSDSVRLARHLCLEPADALRRTLKKNAGDYSLSAMVAQRQSTQLQVAQSLALRAQRQHDNQRKNQAQRTQKNLLDSTAWHAWFDGATKPNPGKMGLGGVVHCPDGQRIEISRRAGLGDSNEAEYLALIAVLEIAVTLQAAKLLVFGDSQVVINDVNRTIVQGALGLEHLCSQAKSLISQLPLVIVQWLPRFKNADADALSQQALEDNIEELLV